MTNKKLDIPPGLLTAVKLAIRNELKDISLVDLKACQEALVATRHALIDMEQKFDVWKKVAELRGEQSEQRAAQIDELQSQVTALQVEIAGLRASIERESGR